MPGAGGGGPGGSGVGKHRAAQLVKAPHANAEARIAAMFEQAFGRAPQGVEMQDWSAALHDFAMPAITSPMNDEAAWAQLAHTIFNTKEFIYYR